MLAESDVVARRRASRRELACDPERQRAVQSGALWAIERARYFDGDHRAWREADIEICSGEIVGIHGSGTSCADIKYDASGLLCLPGLVSASLNGDHAGGDWFSAAEQALAAGFTTVGKFSSDLDNDRQAARECGIRSVLYYVLADRWLGLSPGPPIMSTDACVHRYRQALRSLSDRRISVMPAIGSQFAASPALIVALHEMATHEGRRLAIRVDGGGEHASEFNDAYGCSSVSLLFSLRVLDQHLLAFPITSINRFDWRLMQRSACKIVACVAGSRNQVDRRTISAFDLDGIAAFLEGAGDDPRYRSEDFVDALTWKGAKALTVDNVGKIAIGQRADLLLYDNPTLMASQPHQSASDLFIQCVTRHRPLTIFVDGQSVTGKRCGATRN